jgi:membrane-associated PAP2 superfamily phosphatase
MATPQGDSRSIIKTTMNKNTIYITITLLKALIIITGMVLISLNLISWRKTKDGKKLKKAAIIFGGIFLSTLILTGIELIVAFN